MPPDNVYPCPHCGGTGEHRPTTGEPRYRICTEYAGQEGKHYHGNYSYPEALTEIRNLQCDFAFDSKDVTYTMEEIPDANL